MRRKAIFGVAVVVILDLVASCAYAKDVGPRITIPEKAGVQLLYKGHFTVKVDGGGRGPSGTFECICISGAGTCEVSSISGDNERFLVCEKGKTGTCKSRCSMTTTQ